MTSALHIDQAKTEHFGVIVELIDEARDWLPAIGTDQWSVPWPTENERNERIVRGLELGATWIVWARNRAVATVTTANCSNLKVWSEAECDVTDPAVYAHRLIVAREWAGWGLGAELINWVGLRGQREYKAEWIRIDVWSTNKRLQNYYKKSGFKPCGWSPDPGYPSGALLQKSLAGITEPTNPLFAEGEPDPSPFTALNQDQPPTSTAPVATGGLSRPVVVRPPALSVG
jgi:GNAT superfamily N-acetyltransferase